MKPHEHKPTPGDAKVCSECDHLAYGPIHKPDLQGESEISLVVVGAQGLTKRANRAMTLSTHRVTLREASQEFVDAYREKYCTQAGAEDGKEGGALEGFFGPLDDEVKRLIRAINEDMLLTGPER
jgi:hypothetical protein